MKVFFPLFYFIKKMTIYISTKIQQCYIIRRLIVRTSCWFIPPLAVSIPLKESQQGTGCLDAVSGTPIVQLMRITFSHLLPVWHTIRVEKVTSLQHIDYDWHFWLMNGSFNDSLNDSKCCDERTTKSIFFVVQIVERISFCDSKMFNKKIMNRIISDID